MLLIREENRGRASDRDSPSLHKITRGTAVNGEAEAADEYMNFKRFRRLYRLANLQIARRRRRSRAKYVRGSVAKKAMQPNDVWTMDFVSDRLLHGRKFRALTLVDEFSRFSFAVDPNFSYPSISVVRLLEQIAREHGYPSSLRVDNGPEFMRLRLRRGRSNIT